jgi:dihydrofolate synthase/folylpolyglutamate synthase
MDRYQQTLDHLYKLPGIKLGLENTRRLLKHFGDPQRHAKTIHIGGTNGKGSTAAFADSILRADGRRVGLYTSPHLTDFCERIQVDHQPIERDIFCDWAAEIRSAVERFDLPVTFFEFTTVLAFLHFRARETEWNVIEVGLGGRLDATNLCSAAISVITTVDWDHMDYLGDTLEAIAEEKSGIIHANATTLIGRLDGVPLRIVETAAHSRKSRLLRLGREWSAERQTILPDGGGQLFRFADASLTLENLRIPLLGRYQVDNAGLAVAVCRQAGISEGKPVAETAIRQGLADTQWPGRLEVVGRNPAIVLDCAHNPHGIKNLTETLREYWPFNRCICVLGIMQDKPFMEMIEIISIIADHLILSKPQTERAWNPRDSISDLGHCQKPIEIIDEISYAIHIAQIMSKPGDLVLVTGSLFTVAEARKYLVIQRVNSDRPAFWDPPPGGH